MSRIFLDDDLLSWEVYASGGRYGLPEAPNLVFQCRSEPFRRARYVRHGAGSADAEQAVRQLSDDELREMLRKAPELD